MLLSYWLLVTGDWSLLFR